jgi:hypothetical protein
MILCPQCVDGKFIENIEKKLFFCDECGFKIPIKDGVAVFHPAKSEVHDGFKPSIFSDVLEIEKNHFWIKVRKHFIEMIFKTYVQPEEKIIEVGSGTGNIAGGLFKKGYKDISVKDTILRNGSSLTWSAPLSGTISMWWHYSMYWNMWMTMISSFKIYSRCLKPGERQS